MFFCKISDEITNKSAIIKTHENKYFNCEIPKDIIGKKLKKTNA